MYDKDEYIESLEDKNKYIKKYYEDMSMLDAKQLLKALKKYSKGEGYAISQELRCCFANEFEAWEEDYFGEEGVAYYFDYPAVEKDCIVVLSYSEFYKYLTEECEKYIKRNFNEEKEVKEYLEKIKENLKL